MSHHSATGKTHDNNDGIDGIYKATRSLPFVVDTLELLFILREKFRGLQTIEK